MKRLLKIWPTSTFLAIFAFLLFPFEFFPFPAFFLVPALCVLAPTYRKYLGQNRQNHLNRWTTRCDADYLTDLPSHHAQIFTKPREFCFPHISLATTHAHPDHRAALANIKTLKWFFNSSDIHEGSATQNKPGRKFHIPIKLNPNNRRSSASLKTGCVSNSTWKKSPLLLPSITPNIGISIAKGNAPKHFSEK